MITESVVILGIFLALVIIISLYGEGRPYARHGVMITPFMVVPLVNIAGKLLSPMVAPRLPFDAFTTYLLLMLLALLLSGLLSGILCQRLSTKLTKSMYASSCLLFNAIIAFIFILHAYGLSGV